MGCPSYGIHPFSRLETSLPWTARDSVVGRREKRTRESDGAKHESRRTVDIPLAVYAEGGQSAPRRPIHFWQTLNIQRMVIIIIDRGKKTENCR